MCSFVFIVACTLDLLYVPPRPNNRSTACIQGDRHTLLLRGHKTSQYFHNFVEQVPTPVIFTLKPSAKFKIRKHTFFKCRRLICYCHNKTPDSVRLLSLFHKVGVIASMSVGVLVSTPTFSEIKFSASTDSLCIFTIGEAAWSTCGS